MPEFRKGLNIIYTGNGKGKTTAALGLMLRAWGDGFNVAGIQFIKSEDSVKGEAAAFQKMGIPFESMGLGFYFGDSASQQTHRDAALSAWKHAQDLITSQKYDMLLLDEITYVFHFGWIECSEWIDWVKNNKPDQMHLILTGRDAPQELINFADLVSEVREIKHPYQTSRLPAQLGIEY